MSKLNLEELNLKTKQKYLFSKELKKKIKNGYVMTEDDHMELANINKNLYLEFKEVVNTYPKLVTQFYINKLPVRFKQFGGDSELKEKYNYLLLKTIAEKNKRKEHVSDVNKLIVKNLKQKLLEN
jgi:hypothetical protein